MLACRLLELSWLLPIRSLASPRLSMLLSSRLISLNWLRLARVPRQNDSSPSCRSVVLERLYLSRMRLVFWFAGCCRKVQSSLTVRRGMWPKLPLRSLGLLYSRAIKLDPALGDLWGDRLRSEYRSTDTIGDLFLKWPGDSRCDIGVVVNLLSTWLPEPASL